MPVCRRNIARYRAVCFQEGGEMRCHQCHDHSSRVMWLITSISSLGFCCSDLALDASLGVICDIIPIAISSKPATQFIHKFKCTHYQVRQKTTEAHLLSYHHSFLNRRPLHHRCVTSSHKTQSWRAVKNNSGEDRGFFFFQWEIFRKDYCVKYRY